MAEDDSKTSVMVVGDCDEKKARVRVSEPEASRVTNTEEVEQDGFGVVQVAELGRGSGSSRIDTPTPTTQSPTIAISSGNGNGNGNATSDDVKGTNSSRFTKQEKGKAILLPTITNDAHNLDQSMQPIHQLIYLGPHPHNEYVPSLAAQSQQQKQQQQEEIDSRIKLHQERFPPTKKERFRQIARENASRFAQFVVEPEGDDGDDLSSEDNNVDAPSSQAHQDVEDWPGPFSTALKIIEDRAMNPDVHHQCPSDKPNSVPIIWHPRKKPVHQHCEALVPSLRELCIKLLSENAEAIVSLENIPDDLKNKLSRLLCDSRRMCSHFLGLLFHGSPTEVCVRDCSSITEEQFTASFEGCDTKYLRVLQLDQCGRCMPDYILKSTLAVSFNNLPALTTISLTGACRLSDIGLSALVRAAPMLHSINLSQCSLLTSASFYTLTETLGSVLRELYIDDCQNIDAMHILPALEKLEHLEVLSIAGSQTVCDRFIRKLVAACGRNLKALTLSDCVKLTDASLKSISNSCSGLFALDLVNLSKLTDASLAHLANGCPAMHTLKLRHNAFSDEAIAAFIETCGDTFIELSLNSLRKVGFNTAISLSKHSQNLQTLDLSWCRNLTDEAMGLIVDSCSSLRVLKLFGCTQITDVFLDGHSNRQVKIIGTKMSPI